MNTTAQAVALAAPPTAAELRARDGASWGMGKRAKTYDVTSTPMTLPEAPSEMDMPARVKAALGAGTSMDLPLPRLLVDLGEHVEGIRFATEAHGHAHHKAGEDFQEMFTGLLKMVADLRQRLTAAEMDNQRLAIRLEVLEGERARARA